MAVRVRYNFGMASGRQFESDYAIYISPWNRLAAGTLAAVFLLLAVGAAWYGLVTLGSVTKEILVAVIAAAASLFSVVFTYAFQRAKDVELAAFQKRRELEFSERKAKQENYTRILERLAPYVRNPASGGDEFTSAYLHTCVAGSVEVIKCTHIFLMTRSARSLDDLLRAMRKDLTLESNESDDFIRSENLFPAPPVPAQPQTLQH